MAEKKIKKPAKSKTKSVVRKKVKKSPGAKVKRVGEKKVKRASKSKTKSLVRKKAKKTALAKAKNPIIKLPVTERTHGEDLHLIPVEGEIHPLTTLEVHRNENIFHHREEVALHQENQKMKEAMASRKNAKRIYRITGRR